MKLTEKQKEVIERAKQLEKEYGNGNVFLRWINDYWNVCFVVHKIGDDKIFTHLKENMKVNKATLNALESKGLLTCCDNQHNEGQDPNSWRSKPEDWIIIGSRIKTELI